MSAKDDFELVKHHIFSAASIYGATSQLKRQEELNTAFSRLFTPRPLRELIAKKVRFAFIKTAAGEWMPIKLQAKTTYKVTTLDEPAIPILTPDDMGVK